MKIVSTLEEAKEWFLGNSSSQIMCVISGNRDWRVCSSYTEAEAFYSEEHQSRPATTKNVDSASVSVPQNLMQSPAMLALASGGPFSIS